MKENANNEKTELGTILTHRTVQKSFVHYMVNKGWKRIPNGKRTMVNGISDEVFISEDEEILHVEVKPGNTDLNELWRGVGQTVRILSEPKLKTILVCPEKFGKIALNVLRNLNTGRIGLAVYDSGCNFTPLLNVWGERDIKWLMKKSKVPKELRVTVSKYNIGNLMLRCLKCQYKWIVQKESNAPNCPKCSSPHVVISSIWNKNDE